MIGRQEQFMSPSLPRCEQCGARMTLNPDGGLWCQFCGFIRTDPKALQCPNGTGMSNRRPMKSPGHDWDMDPVHQRRLDIAWRAIQAGDLESAAFLLKDTIACIPTARTRGICSR